MSFTLDGVGLTHANGFVALSDISITAKKGEQIALIGPSGAGKTSLLSVLGTALAPSAGRASVLDFSLETTSTAPCKKPAWGATFAKQHTPGQAPLKSLRSRIGSMHQAPPLPGRQRVVTAVLAGRLGQWPLWKGIASLLYPYDVAGARAALQRLELDDKIFQRCDQLSGGQLQRVGIARVLYQQADLILADEPVSALDPALALATIQLLTAEAGRLGATLVASLHAVDLALSCFPRIIGVKGGQIAFDLPAADVSDALLHALYASEGRNLPTLANEAAQHRPPASPAANDAATRAACC
jgi:phosphonate transport system ATP-binding protein